MSKQRSDADVLAEARAQVDKLADPARIPLYRNLAQSMGMPPEAGDMLQQVFASGRQVWEAQIAAKIRSVGLKKYLTAPFLDPVHEEPPDPYDDPEALSRILAASWPAFRDEVCRAERPA